MDLDSRQSRHRHGLEPRAWPGQRDRAPRGRMPRDDLRARRGAGSPRRRPNCAAAPARRSRARGAGGPGATAEGVAGSSRERSRSSAASTSWSTTSAWPAARTIADTTDAEWQEAFDQTLFPAIRASRLAVPHMRRRGGGAIVMIASIWGRESGGRMTYNAVKAAEISLAKSLAQQLARDNIRVNSVAPGSILFPGGRWHRRQQEDPAAIAEFVRTRTAVRAIRPRRRGRGGGRVPRVAARELDQRRQPHRRRLPVALADLKAERQRGRRREASNVSSTTTVSETDAVHRDAGQDQRERAIVGTGSLTSALSTNHPTARMKMAGTTG